MSKSFDNAYSEAYASLNYNDSLFNYVVCYFKESGKIEPWETYTQDAESITTLIDLICDYGITLSTNNFNNYEFLNNIEIIKLA